MFVKLIVLILALGGTSVGVLSVRQSQLVASNEMTRARMRARELDRRSMELRGQIASSVTPDQIRLMLEGRADLVDETQRRIDLLDPFEPERVDDVPGLQEEQLPAVGGEVAFGEALGRDDYWTLDDGTRVYVVNPED